MRTCETKKKFHYEAREESNLVEQHYVFKHGTLLPFFS